MNIYRSLHLYLLALLIPAIGSAGQAAPMPPEVETFFESRVRPVLAANCYSCHGPQQQMGRLRLDSRAALLAGGQDGLVLEPGGDPDKSLLIQAVRYGGAIKMPPAGPLPHESVDALAAWVKMGAPWPETKSPATASPGFGSPAPAAPMGHAAAAAPPFWSFRPVTRPPLPRVHDAAWVRSPIDAFVLARLEARGLRPAPPADRRTLIRRATLDLIGLPPTPDEVAAFLADRSPGAFAHVVDRLLASPHYGERWGRHWLDVARYSDTKGYAFAEDSRYPYAFGYRDYVVRAFNEDLPYDQFILQQLAADQLPLTGDKRPLAAMGFLTLGRRFLNNPPDIIDDRIDVTTRGLMGLSVACARCHNHKFDPIPTQDYYSLYAIFDSSIEPDPVPISSPARNRAYLAYQQRMHGTEETIAKLIRNEKDRLLGRYRNSVGAYLRAVWDLDSGAEKGSPEALARKRDLNPIVLARWRDYLKNGAPAALFDPWRRYMAIKIGKARGDMASPRDPLDIAPQDQPADDSGATGPTGPTPADGDAPVLSAASIESGRLNPVVVRELGPSPIRSPGDLADRYGRLFADVERDWRDLLAAHDREAEAAAKAGKPAPPAPETLPDPDEESLRQVLYGGGGPLALGDAESEPYFTEAGRKQIEEFRSARQALKRSAPPEPDFAMVLEDAPAPHDGHVFIRGNPGNPGEEAPRRFLKVLCSGDRKPFARGSGRLDLAEAIASPSNPLTARVLVNRVWLYHFGEGIVRTPSDFGARGEPPTHPELLDYLAARFVEGGWSIKKLQRLIMLSSAYQQSSRYDPHAEMVDPENRLLWRMNRHRLDLEALRDSLLAVSGRLDPAIGGPPVEITQAPYPRRRTIYGFIDRQNLPSFFRSFDFASPDATSPGRHHTIVPQQALFMMNSPFVIEQARALAARPEVAGKKAPADRIRALYRLLFARDPGPEEIALGQAFIGSASGPEPSKTTPTGPSAEDARPMTAWEKYAQVLMETNEFAFVD